MSLSGQIKSISYLKAHAAEILRALGDRGERLIITQNGEAKAVLQDIESYEQTQETMALLKILALGTRQIEAGQVSDAADAIARLRKGAHGPLMSFSVRLTDDAALDLEEIFDYVSRHTAHRVGRTTYSTESRRHSRAFPCIHCAATARMNCWNLESGSFAKFSSSRTESSTG